MALHDYYGVVYIEGEPNVWYRFSFSSGSRINGAVGDVRIWPPDQYVYARQLALDYNPDKFHPPKYLRRMPEPSELGAS